MSVTVLAQQLLSAHAFVPQRQLVRASTTPLQVAGIPPNELDTRSFQLSREEINPIISFGKDDKEKVVNGFGLWCLVVSLITGPIWMLAMKIVHRMEGDEHRALYDTTGKIWAKTWLTLTNSYPTISGNMERLKAGNDAGACLFVANHASWLDIPVLCTVLDPVFKFIAKGELAKVPCIGTQLSGVSALLDNFFVENALGFYGALTSIESLCNRFLFNDRGNIF